MSRGHRALSLRRNADLHVAARIALAVATALVLMSSGQALAQPPSNGVPTEVAPPLPAWSMNLFSKSVFRYQNPDLNGCISAATVDMLNLIAQAPESDLPPPGGGSLPQNSLRWTISTSWNTQKNIMWFERKHMTMVDTDKGSDPHGWRNGLNYFGWGSMRADMYRDVAYRSYAEAARAVVDSVARTGKPVGILAWEGGHAQYVTGYTVQGQDPRVGDNYTIVGVFLTDPLREDTLVNTFISYLSWRTGPFYYRFSRDKQTDSPYADPIDGKVGNVEWEGKWVVLQPVE